MAYSQERLIAFVKEEFKDELENSELLMKNYNNSHSIK